MPKYKYVGFTADGKKVENSVEAETVRDAKKILRRQNIRPTKVIEPSFFEADLGQFMVDKGLAKPFGRADLMRFTRQLSILINAGVPILECLEILYKQEQNPVLKRVLKNISLQVEEGKSLYDAMSGQQGFDKLYCALVRAGESAGILDSILVKLAEFLEKAEKLKKQVKSALTYPVIVVFVGIVVIFGLMTFVVPQFVGMLKESNQEIPWVTQVVIDTSNFFQNYTLLLIAGLVAAFMLFINFIKTKEGKQAWDRFTMRAPLFGGLVIKGNLGAFTRTLATMLAAGVPIIDSLEICIDTLDNTQIAKDLTKVRKAVIEGKSITEPLSRIHYFPPLVTQMIKVGESTGNIDQMLIKVADVFEEEVEDLVANLTKMIEPLILVVLGGLSDSC
ncbi:type II secretion system F family protein [Peredibacter starrii]|uniref:General secretion pathway protein F n=1 Tax=Peredibacter starrii TaxID=28202 RepID=A0AAX4HQC3_9BACT|nr:type II secretion system F family protein [Peredibacter starrii]WPU65530.1 type II secretion system F family protein [Peredibacter starrii]